MWGWAAFLGCLASCWGCTLNIHSQYLTNSNLKAKLDYYMDDRKYCSGDRNSVTQLDLYNNRLTDVPSAELALFPGVVNLLLRNNRITRLLDNAFSSHPKLKQLRMESNYLESISANAFGGVPLLDYIRFDSNRITMLQDQIFNPVPLVNYINLQYNSLTRISPTLFNSQKLTTLYLYQNKLDYTGFVHSNLGPSSATLQTLSLGNNPLLCSAGPPDVSSLTNLRSLYINVCKLSHFPSDSWLNTLTQLRTLYLDRNSITSIPVKLLEKQTRLTTLYLYSNAALQIPDKFFATVTALQQLYMYSTKTLVLPDMSPLTDLRTFRAYSSQLTVVQPGAFNSQTNLQEFRLDSNRLTSLPNNIFDFLWNVTNMQIQSNAITSLPVAVFDKATRISTLYLNSMKLPSFPTGIFSKQTRMSNLRFQSNPLTTIPTGLLDGVCALGQRVTYFYMNSLQITTIPAGLFDKCTNMQYIYLNSNALVSLPPGIFSNLNYAHQVHVHTNQLTSLPANLFPNAPYLTHFYFYSNPQLTSLPAALMTSTPRMNYFYGYTCKITTLPADLFSFSPALINIQLQGNELQFLHPTQFDKQTRTTHLYIRQNKITSLPASVFKAMTALRYLQIYTNSLTSLPAGLLDNLNALTQVWFNDNLLTSLPPSLFSLAPNLNYIALSNNRITSLAIGQFEKSSKLRELVLSNNRLNYRLPFGFFDRMSSLYNINLQGNTGLKLPPAAFQHNSALRYFYYTQGSMPMDVIYNNTNTAMQNPSWAGCSSTRKEFNYWGQCRTFFRHPSSRWYFRVEDCETMLVGATWTPSMGSTTAADAQLCQQHCAGTPNCVRFSWKWDKTCQLFDSSATPVSAPSSPEVISGMYDCTNSSNSSWVRTRAQSEAPNRGAIQCTNVGSCQTYLTKAKCMSACDAMGAGGIVASVGCNAFRYGHSQKQCCFMKCDNPFQPSYTADTGWESWVNHRCLNCPTGYLRLNCSAISSGTCSKCPVCPANQYRPDCATQPPFSSAGTCVPCGNCPANSYRTDCGTPSSVAPGICRGCPPCHQGKYRVNCGYMNVGTCVDCAMCPADTYRKGCSMTSPGACEACEPCPAGQYRANCGKTKPFTSPGTCEAVASKPVEVVVRTQVSVQVPLSSVTSPDDLDNSTQTILEQAFAAALAATTALDPSMIQVETEVVDGKVAFTAIITKVELASKAELVDVDKSALGSLLGANQVVVDANNGNAVPPGEIATQVRTAPPIIPPTPPTPIPYNFHRPVWQQNLNLDDILRRPTSWMVCVTLFGWLVLLPLGCFSDNRKDRLAKTMRKEGLSLQTNKLDITSFLAHHVWLGIVFRNPDSLVRSKERVCLLALYSVSVAAVLTSPYGREPRLAHVWWMAIVASLPFKAVTLLLSFTKRNLSAAQRKKEKARAARKAEKRARKQDEVRPASAGNVELHILGDKDVPIVSRFSGQGPYPPPPPLPRISPKPLNRNSTQSARFSTNMRTGRKFQAPAGRKHDVPEDLETVTLLEQKRNAAAAPLPNTQPAAPPKSKKRGQSGSKSPMSQSKTKRGKSPQSAFSPAEEEAQLMSRESSLAWNVEEVYEEVSKKKKGSKTQVYQGTVGSWVRTLIHLLIFLLTVGLAGFAVAFGQREDGLVLQYSLMIMGSIVVFEPLFFAAQIGLCQKREMRRSTAQFTGVM